MPRPPGASLVWLQDGSFDDAVLADVAAAPFKTIYNACIMVEARTSSFGRRRAQSGKILR